MNVCPVCRNINPNDATVCRYCSAALTPPSVAAATAARTKPVWPWIGGVLVAVVLLFVVISQGAAGPGTAQAEGPLPLAVGTGEGASLEFEPATVTAPPDAPVAVTFTNHSTLPHNLTFEDPIAVKTTDVASGASETLNFTTPAPGTYKFVCTIHPGMEGELDVQ
jgi:plastocyanin